MSLSCTWTLVTRCLSCHFGRTSLAPENIVQHVICNLRWNDGSHWQFIPSRLGKLATRYNNLLCFLSDISMVRFVWPRNSISSVVLLCMLRYVGNSFTGQCGLLRGFLMASSHSLAPSMSRNCESSVKTNEKVVTALKMDKQGKGVRWWLSAQPLPQPLP